LVEGSGFEVLVAQLGTEYPENSFEYVIAAKRLVPSHLADGSFPKDIRN
jgi:hypothetical protein